ncbi:unnamed protein product [Oikopleura dioica]|uniref:Uncharacterized protein n=1 Tax=Oikopleura dioica TaxID=34765 RepID=E4XYL1_OIKDI|nr:unnamed protein product [Oikopleura dioica]
MAAFDRLRSANLEFINVEDRKSSSSLCRPCARPDRRSHLPR